MEIVLPKKNNAGGSVVLDNPRNIVIIGANGAGKSRFGRALEHRYAECAFRVSAGHAMCILPDENAGVHSVSELYDRMLSRGAKVEVKARTEFDKLLYLLQQEEFQTLVDFKMKRLRGVPCEISCTRLDRTQRVWEQLFPHSRLLRKGGELEILSSNDENPYKPYRMSQGEKVVFYLIASVLFAPSQALIVVEDPELHLHRSVIGPLWDSIEQSRPDCTFVYMTHDIEFAAGRLSGIRVWVKSYDAVHGSWDYELIENRESFPEEIYLELLGSRKPVLFIEGTDNNSIDNKLYPYIFPDYIVKPLGGCSKVIETTRAFGEMKHFHHLESKGIVDRDRRTSREIRSLRERNIYVPDVAEVENLLMLETVIRTVARRMMQDENAVFETVKQSVISQFEKDIEAQALLHTRHRLRRQIEHMIDRRLETIAELDEHIRTLTEGIAARRLYNDICREFRQYVEDKDYVSVLRVYNKKGMLPQSRVTQLCGLSNKERYLSFILSVLKEDKEDAACIRSAIQHCFGIV